MRPAQLWTPEEDAFLSCPIPAPFLAAGALRHRSVYAIRWRRRQLKKWVFGGRTAAFVCLESSRRRVTVENFSGVDWNLPLKELRQLTGLSEWKICRLRRESVGNYSSKPHRTGRRGYLATDFPGTDWSLSANELSRVLLVSRSVAGRLRREALGLEKVYTWDRRKR